MSEFQHFYAFLSFKFGGWDVIIMENFVNGFKYQNGQRLDSKHSTSCPRSKPF